MSGHDVAPFVPVTSDADPAGAVALAEPARVVAAILRVRRWKLIRLIAISLALAIPGLFDGGIVLIGTGFFGLGAIVFAILLLPGAAWLRLEPAGFTVCHLFRKRSTPWSEVTDFGVALAGRKKLVGYNSRSVTEHSPRMAALSTALSGYNAALPDTYGPRAAELAALLNEVLWRAARARGLDSVPATQATAGEPDRLSITSAVPGLPPPEP
jgi:hypothetical protein